jgi:hypothetical protein
MRDTHLRQTLGQQDHLTQPCRKPRRQSHANLLRLPQPSDPGPLLHLLTRTQQRRPISTSPASARNEKRKSKYLIAAFIFQILGLVDLIILLYLVSAVMRKPWQKGWRRGRRLLQATSPRQAPQARQRLLPSARSLALDTVPSTAPSVSPLLVFRWRVLRYPFLPLISLGLQEEDSIRKGHWRTPPSYRLRQPRRPQAHPRQEHLPTSLSWLRRSRQA